MKCYITSAYKLYRPSKFTQCVCVICIMVPFVTTLKLTRHR